MFEMFDTFKHDILTNTRGHATKNLMCVFVITSEVMESTKKSFIKLIRKCIEVRIIEFLFSYAITLRK